LVTGIYGVEIPPWMQEPHLQASQMDYLWSKLELLSPNNTDLRSKRTSGIATTFIPAAFAACTPDKESSNTRQLLLGTPNFCAPTKKISGAGLP